MKLLGHACGWIARSERIPRDVCRDGDAQTERRLMQVAAVRTASVGAVEERG
jgi:hypothetical protein